MALRKLLTIEGQSVKEIEASLDYRRTEEENMANQNLASNVSVAASIALALFTLGLLMVTWQYVKTTKKLVQQNEQQAQRTALREQTEKHEKVRALHIICQQLLSDLDAFPLGELNFGQRPPVTWNEEDVGTLKLLLYNLWGNLGLAAKDTTGVVSNLHWISDAVQYLKGVPPGGRQEYDMLYKPKFQSRMSEALQGLEKVIASCQNHIGSSAVGKP